LNRKGKKCPIYNACTGTEAGKNCSEHLTEKTANAPWTHTSIVFLIYGVGPERERYRKIGNRRHEDKYDLSLEGSLEV
jgi:hypothetical protein